MSAEYCYVAICSDNEWKAAKSRIRNRRVNSETPYYGEPTVKEVQQEVRTILDITPVPTAQEIRECGNEVTVDADGRLVKVLHGYCSRITVKDGKLQASNLPAREELAEIADDLGAVVVPKASTTRS